MFYMLFCDVPLSAVMLDSLVLILTYYVLCAFVFILLLSYVLITCMCSKAIIVFLEILGTHFLHLYFCVGSLLS